MFCVATFAIWWNFRWSISMKIRILYPRVSLKTFQLFATRNLALIVDGRIIVRPRLYKSIETLARQGLSSMCVCAPRLIASAITNSPSVLEDLLCAIVSIALCVISTKIVGTWRVYSRVWKQHVRRVSSVSLKKDSSPHTSTTSNHSCLSQCIPSRDSNCMSSGIGELSENQKKQCSPTTSVVVTSMQLYIARWNIVFVEKAKLAHPDEWHHVQ